MNTNSPTSIDCTKPSYTWHGTYSKSHDTLLKGDGMTTQPLEMTKKSRREMMGACRRPNRCYTFSTSHEETKMHAYIIEKLRRQQEPGRRRESGIPLHIEAPRHEPKADHLPAQQREERGSAEIDFRL